MCILDAIFILLGEKLTYLYREFSFIWNDRSVMEIRNEVLIWQKQRGWFK